MIQVKEHDFEKRWVCQVVRSGYHNGANCSPNAPHGDWGCEYRYEISWSEAKYLKRRTESERS